MKEKLCIYWFRRDLRLEDNAGLYHALISGSPVLPIFIFDTEILQGLAQNDARVTFIHSCLEEIRKELVGKFGSNLAIYLGKPHEVFRELDEEYDIQAVYCNSDYEPYARKRDGTIGEMLRSNDIEFKEYKDQVIFEKGEVVKQDGSPYLVYTPFMKRWKQLFNPEISLAPFDSLQNADAFVKETDLPWKSLDDIGFVPSEINVPTANISNELIRDYEKTRNFPSLKDGTSRLGPHLRFGTVSIRAVAGRAVESTDDTFLKELIWREFFMQILWHFPKTVYKAFKPQYDRIKWRNDKEEFEAWKNGKTGYALVDAGMRELNTTGYMHNRVRMLVASFLCKHLLIDWRWGEAYFAEKLLDFELSSNVGNWQWAAGCGVDAAPYFRIFNPMTQAEKFDKSGEYIRRWIPEINSPDYISPIVDHKMARARCLEAFKTALDQ